MAAPLAERIRPRDLDHYVGQSHLVGPDGPVRAFVESGRLPSLLFWGPPGVGKTTLARILAAATDAIFVQLSAVDASVKDVRKVIQTARSAQGAVLFIDEIHRFNKAQQDSLLGAVEAGVLTLVGATTENPSFEVIPALLSRCQVFRLQPLSDEDLRALLHQAVTEDPVLGQREIHLDDPSLLIAYSGGDARRLLNFFEIVVGAVAEAPVRIDDDLVRTHLAEFVAVYDKGGEQHYDVISAFIKSIRGSDPQAALFYLARMIEGGEDPSFIARRLLILASEDIGNANPTALVLANACFQAVNVIGYPECRIILSQAVTYLASSPKSNASYTAIGAAQALARKHTTAEVPLHLRNAPTKLMQDMGYGREYLYAHDHPGHFAAMEFMPEGLEGTTFYRPADNPRENALRDYLKRCWGDKYDI